MGCSSSKEVQIVLERGNAPMTRSFSRGPSRSFSLPSRKQSQKENKQSMHMVLLTSSTYGLLKMDVTKNYVSSEICDLSFEEKGADSTGSKAHDLLCEENISNNDPFLTKLEVRKATDQAILSSNDVTDVINVRELMEGLEEDVSLVVKPGTRKKKAKGHRRSVSSSHLNKVRKLKGSVLQHRQLVEISTAPNYNVSYPGLWCSTSERKGSFMSCTHQPCSRRAFVESEQLIGSRTAFSHHNCEYNIVVNNAELKLPTSCKCKKYSTFLPKNNIPVFKAAETCTAVPITISNIEDLLLREGPFHSNVEHPPNKHIMTNRNNCDVLDPGSTTAIMPEKIRPMQHNQGPKEFSTENTKGSRSPLFDSVALSTREKTLLNQQSLTDNTYCGNETLSNSITDALSLIRQPKDCKEICTNYNGLLAPNFSAVATRPEARRTLNSTEEFKSRCPPEGEDRVVLYVTSLRGIRKTYEDCNLIKSTLQSFKVRVDERDIFIHSEFKLELKDLHIPLSVPRLFIKGRYIGGVEEFSRLNEDGMMAKLLEELSGNIFNDPCECCGGIRFIPCTNCNGSCKIVTRAHERKTRCPDCNENGLIRCQLCY